MSQSFEFPMAIRNNLRFFSAVICGTIKGFPLICADLE
jgi:hypothetical protein